MPNHDYEEILIKDRKYIKDLVTGEIMGPVSDKKVKTAFFSGRERAFPKKGITMFQDWLMAIAKDDLTQIEMRTLCCVLSYLDYHNKCDLTHKQIAEIIGTQRPKVTKALKRLVDKGYLTRSDNIHYLSLQVGWKGSRESWWKAVNIA